MCCLLCTDMARGTQPFLSSLACGFLLTSLPLWLLLGVLQQVRGEKSKQQDIQPTLNVPCNCWKLMESCLCIRCGTVFVHVRPFPGWANCSATAMGWSWHQSIAMLLIDNMQNTSLSATTHQGLTQKSITKLLMGYEDDHSAAFSLRFC